MDATGHTAGSPVPIVTHRQDKRGLGRALINPVSKQPNESAVGLTQQGAASFDTKGSWGFPWAQWGNPRARVEPVPIKAPWL